MAVQFHWLPQPSWSQTNGQDFQKSEREMGSRHHGSSHGPSTATSASPSVDQVAVLEVFSVPFHLPGLLDPGLGLFPMPESPLPSSAALEISLLQGQVPGACSQRNCEIIMVGDFNLNWMEKCCTTADSFAMDFHLTKLISQPTRLYLKVVIIHY